MNDTKSTGMIAAVIDTSYYVDMSRHMDVKTMQAKKAQAAFSALAQPTRLKAFRRLVAAHLTRRAGSA